MKMIKVDDATHLLIKTKASAKGMTIKDYLQYLAENDK